MVTTILARYFAGRFVIASVATFAAIFVLIITVDYIELMRRAGGLANVSGLFVAQTALFRVPLSLEKLMPFCILIGAMVSFLALSRRLELVVARASGISAWQFTTPALISALVLGTLATVIYNPLSAEMLERAKGMERRIFTDGAPTLQDGAGFWLNHNLGGNPNWEEKLNKAHRLRAKKQLPAEKYPRRSHTPPASGGETERSGWHC